MSLKSVVVAKLKKYHSLSPEAVNEIDSLIVGKRMIERGAQISVEGDTESPIWVLLDGWACRYVILPNGERQIVGLMTPGDFCDTRAIRLSVRNFGVAALSEVTIAQISSARFNAVLDRHRDVVLAFAKAQLADESIMQTWIANMARKTAPQRMAHLLCEMVSRMSRSSDRPALTITLPLAQADLADILGMSAVHVNRVLQSLRASGLITLRSHRLEVNDFAGLAAIAEFDADYLYYDEGDTAADHLVQSI